MASIFDKYGIKEVVDGVFYALSSVTIGGATFTTGQPVLLLDSLKVSTVETTASETEAKGGRGNASLIAWDFGKEINVTLQDALISPLSWALMTGGTVAATNGTDNKVTIQRRYRGAVAASGTNGVVNVPTTEGTIKANSTVVALVDGATALSSATWTGTTVTITGLSSTAAGTQVDVFYEVELTNTGATGTVITIDAETFPGTFKFVGDTVIRKASTGVDEPFQIVIEKCKIKPENTITMEAEGDPSVFDMNLKVLRDSGGNMIKFIKYNLA